MGDWLDTGAAFGGNVRTVLDADSSARIRAGDLGRAVRRGRGIGTCSSSIRTGSSRTRTARRCDPIASRSADGAAVRGTRSTARIRQRRSHLEHVFRTMRERMGLHLLQARRQLLGRDARRTVPRRARDARRGVPPRHAGDRSRRRRQLPPRLQSSDLAVARPDPRIAQLERHQAHLGSHQDDRRVRTCSATGRTDGCGGTIRMRLCWRAS